MAPDGTRLGQNITVLLQARNYQNRTAQLDMDGGDESPVSAKFEGPVFASVFTSTWHPAVASSTTIVNRCKPPYYESDNPSRQIPGTGYPSMMAHIHLHHLR
jgi:hypothetical protein